MNQPHCPWVITTIGLPALLALQSGCSSNGASTVDVATFRTTMQGYDQAVERVLGSTVAIGDATDALQQQLLADDDAAVDAAAATLAQQVDALLAGLPALEQRENALQGDDLPREGMISQKLLFTLGVGLVIYGTYTFAKKMKSLSDDLTKARNERDDAANRTMNGDPAGPTDLQAAKKKMNDIGEEAVKEFGSKVTTELVLAPIEPVSAGGMILKDAAGNLLQDGLKVISSSKGCGENPAGDSCRLSVGRTSSGRVAVPAGTQSVVISTPGKARIAIPEVTVTAGADTEIRRELIPIEQATPETTAANDKGEYQPGPATPDGETGGGDGGALGTKCQTLAACCPTITDIEYLRQSCDKEVASGLELNCSVMLGNLTHLHYCE